MGIEYARLPSPVGTLHVYARNDALSALSFSARSDDQSRREEAALARRFPNEAVREAHDPAGAASALQRYFDGDLRALEGLQVDPGGTPFQASVWQALRLIAPGTTISYMELARRIGATTAVRAVGAANGANPIAIVIPCHRVIGASGKLVGYGGGLDRKRWLLEHEQGRPALFSR